MIHRLQGNSSQQTFQLSQWTWMTEQRQVQSCTLFIVKYYYNGL